MLRPSDDAISATTSALAEAGGLSAQVLRARLADATGRTAEARARVLGFPAASDLDYSHTAGLLAGLVNHLGDPERPGRWPVHLLDLEREVITVCLELFGGHPATCWGYVTAGGSSEGVLHGLWLGRERFPDAHVYASTAAHYSVAKAARLLGLPLTLVEADASGMMRPDHLTTAAARRAGRAVLLVVTVGTTMTEAVDDLPALHAALDAAAVRRRHVVVDAALSGPALALEGGPVAALLAEPGGGSARMVADSVCFSGHKFLGTPLVSGVALARREHVARIGRAVDYIASDDRTVSGSRSGLPVAQLWWALHHHGRDGLRERARRARVVAAHAVAALHGIGWRAWRHEHACTVVIDAPPQMLARRWALPITDDGRSHVVCVPGVTTDRIDRFVAELAAHTDRAAPLPPVEEDQP